MVDGSGEDKASVRAPAVFISYASQDAAAAARICSALHQAGVEVWFDRSELRGGDVWDQRIRREVRDCTLFMPVISANTASRHEGYFRLEWDLADQRTHMMARDRAFIVPVCLDATTEVGTDVPESFQRVQWTRLLDGNTPPAFTARIVALLGVPSAAASAAGSSHSAAQAGHGAPPALTLTAPAKATLRKYRLPTAVMATLTVILAYVAIDRYWLSKHAPAEKPAAVLGAAPTAVMPAIPAKSVAVLPFADMSEKRDQEYFADGMAEEIINRLAKASDLHVPGRTSAFYFKGKPTKISDVARELGVANVLEGSIRRSGNHLRVTVQLVRADNGYHRWSETYDRDLRDVFKVQDEIANAVAQALQITLMGGPLTRPKGGTQNLDAYQLYLRAVSAAAQPTESSLAAARGYLDRALKLDPAFGLAWTQMAQVISLETDNGVLAPRDGYERTRRLALHALEVNPELADAHVLLQYVHRTFDWDWAASEREGRLALKLDPNNQFALMNAGALSSTLGHWDDAERDLRAAIVRDPLFTYAHWNLGTGLYLAGRFSAAEAAYRRLIEIAPGFSWAYSNLGLTLLAEGKPDAALSIVQQDQEEADRLQVLPIVLQAAGRKAEADQSLKTLIARFADTAAYWVAANYAYRGDRELAFEWLERAYQQKDSNLVTIVGEPLFKNLASDPRYTAFLRKMNLPE